MTAPACAACGSPLTPGLPACSRCGRAVDTAAAPEPAGAEPTPTPAFELSAAPVEPRVETTESPAGGGHRRRWILFGAGGAVVAAAAVVTTLLLTGGSDTPSPQDQRARDARDVAAALDTLAQDPAAIRAGGGELAGVDARAAVPDGAKVAPDETTWQPDGGGGGVMTVTLTAADGTVTRYLAVMVHEDTGWKVLETFPAPATSATPAPTAVSS